MFSSKSIQLPFIPHSMRYECSSKSSIIQLSNGQTSLRSYSDHIQSIRMNLPSINGLQYEWSSGAVLTQISVFKAVKLYWYQISLDHWNGQNLTMMIFLDLNGYWREALRRIIHTGGTWQAPKWAKVILWGVENFKRIVIMLILWCFSRNFCIVNIFLLMAFQQCVTWQVAWYLPRYQQSKG